MSSVYLPLPPEDFAKRRAHLTDQIARQRGELAHAFRELEKPILYGEYALRGLGFLRANTWIFVAVPGVIGILRSLLGWKKGRPAPVAARQAQSMEKPAKGFIGTARKAGGYAWQAFQLYRRVRPYFM